MKKNKYLVICILWIIVAVLCIMRGKFFVSVPWLAIAMINLHIYLKICKWDKEVVERLEEIDGSDKMTEQEFKAKATELIKSMVDTIADKEYIKLVSSIPPKPSWASFNDAESTPENDCLGFGKWLDEQLAMWEEDEDKKFVVDHFNESCIDEIELEDDSTSFVSYRPTSFGEELDFWFEIDFEIKDEQINAKFDVNL